MMKRFLFIVLCIFLAASTHQMKAQNLYEGNPADPYLLEAAFSNPALNAGIIDRAALAMTVHHVGVGGDMFALRSGIISYHMPWQVRGMAIGGQFFQAGLYSQTDFRLSYGRRVLPQLSLGANVDLFSRSFDKSRFFKFEEGDPVFANGYGKIAASFGVGAVVEPYQNLAIGLAFEHFNQPDLALGEDPFVQPLVFSLGIKWLMPSFNVSSSVNRLEVGDYSRLAARRATDDMAQETQLGAEIPIGRSWLRFNSDPTLVQVEAEVPLYRSLYVNYRYGYPLSDINLASIGSQRFGFLYDFNRLPRLSSLPSLPILPSMPSEAPMLNAAPHGQFFVYASTDSLNVIQRTVRRTIEPDVPEHTLAMLLPGDLDGASSSASPDDLQELDVMKVRDPAVRPKGLYSTRYRGALEGIGLQSRMPGSNVQSEVISFPGGERRANALANMMTGDRIAVPAKVPIYAAAQPAGRSNRMLKQDRAAEEVQELVVPNHAAFHIVPIFRSFEGSRWSLEVRSSKDAKVFEYSGTNQPPDSLTWNWRDPSGELVPSGSYYYRASVTDRTGNTAYSERGSFDVTHRHQSLTIDVTTKPKTGEVAADKYILIVGAEGAGNQSVPADTTLDRGR